MTTLGKIRAQIEELKQRSAEQDEKLRQIRASLEAKRLERMNVPAGRIVAPKDPTPPTTALDRVTGVASKRVDDAIQLYIREHPETSYDRAFEILMRDPVYAVLFEDYIRSRSPHLDPLSDRARSKFLNDVKAAIGQLRAPQQAVLSEQAKASQEFDRLVKHHMTETGESNYVKAMQEIARQHPALARRYAGGGK
jgi:hypothetical protein